MADLSGAIFFQFHAVFDKKMAKLIDLHPTFAIDTASLGNHESPTVNGSLRF